MPWACVIVIMTVTLHAGKSMMTNMLVSKTMHHSPAHTVLGHSLKTLSFGSFYKNPVLPDVFPSHPIVPTPHSSCHTFHHTDCVTCVQEQSGTELVQFHIAQIFSVTTSSYGYSFLCLVGCFSMIIWTPAVLSVLYACVLYFCICTCSA